LLISGPFINNDYSISWHGQIDIDLEPDELFINNTSFFIHGSARLEGELINNANLSFEGVNGELTLANNSKLVNNGVVEVTNCYMSSQMQSGTTLGNFIVNDNLYIKASIPEIF
jgi:hypothetical protein